MKKLTLLIVLGFLSATVLFAQNLPVDTETKKITFQETVSLDSLSREEIYQRSKEWIANFYKTDKYALDDRANFKVAKEGSFEIQLTYDYKYKSQNNVGYTVQIAQREGRYRYTITDFTFYNLKTGVKTAQNLEVALAKMSGQNKGEATTQINKEIADVVEALKKFLLTGKVESREDW
jgi:K+ transporter